MEIGEEWKENFEEFEKLTWLGLKNLVSGDRT
jgi:hypothetical protein